MHQANASTVACKGAAARLADFTPPKPKASLSNGPGRYYARKKPPILQSLHDWLLQTRAQTANGGGTAKAIDYPEAYFGKA
ncbi:MAG: hypothetical protein IPI17_00005 [Nitrosomonas sp.]|nr:hypothetical protein [Nitrosomonas sp.]